MMFLSACGGDNDNGQPPQPTATKPAPTATQPAPTATKPAPTATQPVPTATQPVPTATQPGPTATQGGATPTVTQPVPTATTGAAVCGNGTQEGDEQCDDGNTVGGDGCASNCTNEHRRECIFTTGTGSTVQTKLFAIPLTLTGNQTLTTGEPRVSDANAIVPVVIKPEDVNYDPVAVPGLVCACVRGIAAPALGGNSAQGQVGCSDAGLQNTDYLYSLNHNIGKVGVNGFTEADCTAAGGTVEDGSTAHPHSGVCNSGATITFSGSGGRGSSVIESNTGISLISDGGACVTDGTGDPALYGDDGSACTPDDPGQATPNTLATTSGTATAEVLNASNVNGSKIQSGAQCGATPCLVSVTGVAVNCDAVLADPTGGLSGAANGAAFGSLDAASIGDNVTTSSTVCQ